MGLLKEQLQTWGYFFFVIFPCVLGAVVIALGGYYLLIIALPFIAIWKIAQPKKPDEGLGYTSRIKQNDYDSMGN